MTSISMSRRKSMREEKEGDRRDWKYCTQASQIVLPAVGFGFFPWADFYTDNGAIPLINVECYS